MSKIVRLAHPSGARAWVHPYGAHVTSWMDATGRERLYVSRRSHFGGGRAIRGGIPVVFPQFADTGPLPKHGLLRTRVWEVTRSAESLVTLRARDDEASRSVWPHAFLAEVSVELDEGLRVSLRITNTGATSFWFTGALHSYFAVEDIRRVRVGGLRGCGYVDKTRGFERRVDGARELAIEEFTDRVYEGAPPRVVLAGLDGGNGGDGAEGMALETEGFGDWVVWNPWEEHSRKFDDMEPEDYRRMVCVEAARIAKPVVLAPSEAWTGVQVARVVEA